MKIKYSEDFGRLKFSCEKNGFKLSDTVPDSIINKGKVAIIKYVNERMDRHISKTKRDNIKNKERAERRTNTNVCISVIHGNQNLKGRIIDYGGDGERGLVTIILESPKKYGGNDSIYSCFGMAMGGIRVFDDKGYLTKWAIDTGKKSLVEIYERNKKREIAEKLNKDLTIYSR